MRLGWCAPLEAAPLLASQGWDYAEVPLAPLGIGTAAGRRAALALVAAAPLPVEAATHLVPPSVNLFTADGRRAFAALLGPAAGFLAEAGVAVAIFGGRETRRMPPGLTPPAARAILAEALHEAAAAFAGSGCRFVLEALCDAPDDPVTGFADAAALARAAGLGTIADSFHMARSGEPPGLVALAGPTLAHVHLADRDRRAPRPGGFDLEPWAGALEAAGYWGRVSVECVSDDLAADAAAALQFLRRRWPKE
jgi:sugar phosphate isomerase/epimerase